MNVVMDALGYAPIIARWQAVAVVIAAGIALSLVVWALSALVIDRWVARRQPRSLSEWLTRSHPSSVADEAHRWLEEQQKG